MDSLYYPGSWIIEGEKPSPVVPTVTLFCYMPLAYEDSVMLKLVMVANNIYQISKVVLFFVYVSRGWSGDARAMDGGNKGRRKMAVI